MHTDGTFIDAIQKRAIVGIFGYINKINHQDFKTEEQVITTMQSKISLISYYEKQDVGVVPSKIENQKNHHKKSSLALKIRY